MTNELRKELEKQYDRAAAEAEKEKHNLNSSLKEREQKDDEYLNAPRSFKKEYVEIFKTLPPVIRKYLCERESEIERGFSKLNNELSHRRWIDDVFASRADRLKQLGINKAQDWIETMAKIDDALECNPQDALEKLAEVYGVSLGKNFDCSSLISKLDAIEKKISFLSDDRDARYQDAEQIAESQKAKEASFAPKGKNRLAKDLSKLTTREVLELKLAEYDD